MFWLYSDQSLQESVNCQWYKQTQSPHRTPNKSSINMKTPALIVRSDLSSCSSSRSSYQVTRRLVYSRNSVNTGLCLPLISFCWSTKLFVHSMSFKNAKEVLTWQPVQWRGYILCKPTAKKKKNSTFLGLDRGNLIYLVYQICHESLLSLSSMLM